MEKDKNIDEAEERVKKTKTSNKSKKVNKEQNNKKGKKGKNKFKILKRVILIFFLLSIILILAGVGIFAGIFFSDKWKIEKSDLEISLQNTVVYDIEGKQIAELAGDENRKIISIGEMGPYLPNAFVAIEDERYYDHYGIDIKRTAGAIATYILNRGKSDFGGSTITQQLVKNMMQDDASEGAAGVERKIREWSRAYQIEQMLSKSQILELYLNKIFMGNTVYGVESASQYYFSKSAKDLNLAEAAFIAGINHAPNGYDPFSEKDNSDDIKSRTKIVISQMKKLRGSNRPELKGLSEITDEEYDKAIEEIENGLDFKRGTLTDNSNISYHTAAAIDQVASQLAEEKEVNYQTARDMVKNGGYKLYTTQNSSIQDVMEAEYLKTKYIKKATTKAGKKNNEHSQSAMVIIDHSNGYVVGTVGGLGSDSSPLGLNRATQSYRQTGSAMKPLAAVGPALEEKVITAATLYDDSKTYFGGESYRNAGSFRGIMTVRQGIECSSNMVNMKVISNLGTEKGVKYVNEFGLSQYTVKDDASITLALGGTTHGASPLQMAAAYATIANKGEYIEPTFYTKLENSTGHIVLEPKQETRRVISEQTAYVLQDILKTPVYGFKGGATATSCAISGVETRAKTGTTTSYNDKWLCGFTPYYAAVTWFGYDTPETIEGIANADNPAQPIWASVMKSIHKELKGKSFTKPSGVVSATICLETGKVATEGCKSIYTEIFIKGTIPETCEGHEPIKICKESQKLATEFCPEVEEVNAIIRPEKEKNSKWKLDQKAEEKYNDIEETCDLHTEETMNARVPDVVGKMEAEAKAELALFAVQVVTESDASKANGVVLKQSLSAGESVAKGSAITITVNTVVINTQPTNPTPSTPTTPTTPTTPVTPTPPEPTPTENTQVTDDPSGQGNTQEVGSPTATT